MDGAGQLDVMLVHRMRNMRPFKSLAARLVTSRQGLCSPFKSRQGLCSPATNQQSDEVRTLLQVFVDTHFISPGETNVGLFGRGLSCSYGPLGMELRRNVLHEWWSSVTGSRAQVFGINTPSSTCGHLDMTHLDRTPCDHMLRNNLLHGALEQFVPSFELVNKNLPFGLAETGRCFHSSKDDGSAEVTLASLVWFCSPRTSSQWLDHWAGQRLKWWRKFALAPCDFSSSDVPQEELEGPASRGVKIFYKFPWGQEPLEVLWSRGDGELMDAHTGVRSKLLSPNGRKSIPHVVSITGKVERGLLAFLCNSLHLHKREDARQRKMLKLHPLLAPIKVALGIGRGATMELRQVCEGLLQELKEAKISVWPGHLEATSTPLEQLHSKYDEMGVLFSAVISDKTLESGLLLVRSRDTAIKETMHISHLKNFLCRYISAADNM
ncbi:DNA polymerase subunit gamma-2, mitochondrial [Entelurus aequoreus]|uniref:DNA polymerase subunit gamma-2, mitochondrial n=1 Tax=Entelurus aequoreus TaxID=161455 RepID=UPI002B1DBE93|nr:DNA polymerase subunit gamma-2, mitochondrial [Entelurus aequoreus]